VSIREAHQEHAIKNGETNIQLIKFWPGRSSVYQDVHVEFWVCKALLQIGYQVHARLDYTKQGHFFKVMQQQNLKT